VKYIKEVIVLSIVGLVLSGCISTSPEEEAKADAYAQQYKEEIEQYIKEYYGDDIKILKIYGDAIARYDAVMPKGEYVANGNVVARVEQNKQKFNIIYFPDTDAYKTDKNEKLIEESLRNYIEREAGEDNVLHLEFRYASSEYSDYSNFVDLDVVSYQQIFDNYDMVFIECFLKDTNFRELKYNYSFSYLERLMEEGSNESGRMEALFINLENYKKLSEKELRKMYGYTDQTFFRQNVEIDGVYYSGVPYFQYYSSNNEIVDYTAEYPDNTYFIGRTYPDGEFISLIY